MRTCILGIEVVDVSGFSSLEIGFKITRAALVADDSNYWADCEPQKRIECSQSQLTRGSTSVGLSWMA